MAPHPFNKGSIQTKTRYCAGSKTVVLKKNCSPTPWLSHDSKTPVVHSIEPVQPAGYRVKYAHTDWLSVTKPQDHLARSKRQWVPRGNTSPSWQSTPSKCLQICGQEGHCPVTWAQATPPRIHIVCGYTSSDVSSSNGTSYPYCLWVQPVCIQWRELKQYPVSILTADTSNISLDEPRRDETKRNV